MVCVDGVILGNTSSSILGIDMSKDWKDPNQLKNPVAYELKRYLRSLETDF